MLTCPTARVSVSGETALAQSGVTRDVQASPPRRFGGVLAERTANEGESSDHFY